MQSRRLTRVRPATDDSGVIVPEALRPGDRIRIIAPSGPFDRTLLYRGAGWLARRYRVELDPALFCREGYLAGSDARRRDELQRALDEPGLRAVVAARGGYGLTRIAHQLDFSGFRAAPRWIVGFSDITALHVEAARAGVASLHAHNAAGLGRGDAAARARFVDALENPLATREHPGLACWVPGRASGPLCGGNLTMLFTCAAARRLYLPEGGVLFLEDVTESSYRLDRMLTALAVGGHLDRIAAVVVGDFTSCPAGPFDVPAETAVRACLSALGVPVAAGLGAGHDRWNEPLLLGATAELDATRGELLINPPAARPRRR